MRKLLIIALMFFSQVNVVESATAVIPHYIRQYARMYGIDPVLMYAIAKVESNHNPKALNRNDGNSRDKQNGIVKRSYGLFQLQLTTIKEYGFTGNPKLLLNPQVNALFAARHLNKLYKHHQDTVKVLSAYNAGHVSTKNKSYVDKVVKYYVQYKIDGRF